MQKYKCHKEVEAAKIAAIEPPADRLQTGNWKLSFGDAGWVSVAPSWMGKHTPEVGGYYVRYAGGYESFSPADVFEAGYTAIDTNQGN